MNVKQEDKEKIIKYYLGKPLHEKKGFFPSREGFRWVSLNKEKAVNDIGNLTEYAKDKLLEQNIKAEFAYNGYDGPTKPAMDDVKDVCAKVKADMVAKGAW